DLHDGAFEFAQCDWRGAFHAPNLLRRVGIVEASSTMARSTTKRSSRFRAFWRTSMEALDLARWQFGITTVYHFFFVPLTIGLVLLVAVFQTIWHRRGDERYLRLTRFFGKLFLINFAMGLVTG